MALRPKTTEQVLKQQQADAVADATKAPPTDTADVTQRIPIVPEMEAVAITFAQDAGDMLDSDLDDIYEARLTQAMGPLAVLMDLRKDFGREKLAEFPEPGSTKAEAGNQNYDKYSKAVIVDGESKSRAQTWYGTFHDHMARGKALVERIRKIELRSKETNEFTAWHTEDANQELKVSRQRRSTRVNVVRRAINIERQCVAFETELKGKVAYRFAYKLDPKTGKRTDELLSTPYPIVVYDVEAPERPEVVSITTFLSYDVKEASKKNGTLADLRTSIERDTQKRKDTGGIPTVAEAEAMVAMLGHAFEDEQWLGLLFKRMNSDKGLDIVRTLGDIYMELVPLYNETNGRFLKKYRQAVGQMQPKPAKAAAK